MVVANLGVLLLLLLFCLRIDFSLGDSRAILGKYEENDNLETVVVSKDHTAESEKIRI